MSASKVTTACRQSNYLIMRDDNESVSVSIYFRIGNDLIAPTLKSKLRGMKNQLRNYDEGEIMVRELTCDSHEVPGKAQLNRLCKYLKNYEELTDIKTFTMLFKRARDYHTLRHVDKSLVVVEYLLEQQAPFHSASFEKYCREQHRHEFVKLSNFVYKVDGADIGHNVRRRASDIYYRLFGERIGGATGMKHQMSNGTHAQKLLDDGMFEHSVYDMQFVEEEEQMNAKNANGGSENAKHSQRNKQEKERLSEVQKMIHDDDDKKHNHNQDLHSSNSSNSHRDEIFDIFGELPPIQVCPPPNNETYEDQNVSFEKQHSMESWETF